MKTSALSIIILSALVWMVGSCAPTIIGSPKHTGLILFEGEIIDGSGRTHKIQTVVLERKNPPKNGESRPEKAKSFGKYIVFDNLTPGSYNLKRVSSYLYIFVREMSISVSIGDRSVFDVQPGRPLYIGKIVIKIDYTDIESAELEIDPENEVRAWKAFLKAYGDTPWAVPVQERLTQSASS